jgi:hypothetical protein
LTQLWLLISVVLLSCSACRPRDIGRSGAIPDFELTVVAVPSQSSAPLELWLILRNSSAAAVPMVCPSGWALKSGRTSSLKPDTSGNCDDLAKFSPILPGGTLVHRVQLVESHLKGLDGPLTGISLVFVETSLRGLGREYGEATWSGDLAAARSAGERLLAADNQR